MNIGILFFLAYYVPDADGLRITEWPGFFYGCADQRDVLLVHPGADNMDSLYWYNCVDYYSIGICKAGTLHWAVRFTIPDSLDGSMIKEAGVYIHESMGKPGAGQICFGTHNSPGTPVASWEFHAQEAGWQVHDLSDDSIFISEGDQLWARIQQYNESGQYPASVDSGPCVINYGCWVSLDGSSWSNLSDYGLSYNWNIYVIVSNSSGSCEGSKHLPLSLKAPSVVSVGSFHISYSLPRESNVSLVIYDGTGRAVKVLDDGTKCPGEYEFNVNMSRAGVYFIRLETRFGVLKRKVIVRP